MFLRKQKSKRDTYKIQQAISKAINTTGPSVVTFLNLPSTLPPRPPLQAHPTCLTPPQKVNNKEKRQRSGRMHI